jgi:hypothetical protein
MKNKKPFFAIIILFFFLSSCSPRTVEIKSTPTHPISTNTFVPATVTSTPLPLPTETSLPTSTSSPTPPSCTAALNPINNAIIPAKGPFDFSWTAFNGAVSYDVSIGPTDWFPTKFETTDTSLTRYMETFPSAASYQWSISAINASGQQICVAGPYKFVTSRALYATPSFAGGVIISTSNNNTSGDQGDQNPQPITSTLQPQGHAKILSITDNPDCSVSATFELVYSGKIALALVRVRTQPQQWEGDPDSSPEFEVRPISAGNYPEPSIYEGTSNFLGGYKNGQVVYITAVFISETGLAILSSSSDPNAQHTITTCGG